jgi:hypothetical protein
MIGRPAVPNAARSSQEKKFIVEPHIPPFADFQKWKVPLWAEAFLSAR